MPQPETNFNNNYNLKSMIKTNLFLRQCLAIVMMFAMVFVVSCSEDDTSDVEVDDQTTQDDDDDDDDDDDTSPETEDKDTTTSLEALLAELGDYIDLIPQGAVTALVEADEVVAANPILIESAIATHAAAVAAAEEGFVVTSYNNGFSTLTLNYRVAGVDSTLNLTKGGVEVVVTDDDFSSVIDFVIDGETYSIPKGYADNITSLIYPSTKISLLPGEDVTVTLKTTTVDDEEVNGYINHISGFTTYATEGAITTKADMSVVSVSDLRVTSAELSGSTITLALSVASDVEVDWGYLAIKYAGVSTADLVVTSDDLVLVESFASGNCCENDCTYYVADAFSSISYSLVDDESNNKLNYYLWGIDNSGDDLLAGVVLSEELAIESYEIKLYEITGDAADITGENLLLGTSEAKDALVSSISNMSGLTALTASDYISANEESTATIALYLDLEAMSTYAGYSADYLVVVSGTTKNSSDNNSFVLSKVITVDNEQDATISISPSSKSVDCLDGEVDVVVTSNTHWVVAEDEDYSWITLSADDGSSAGTITVSYDPNEVDGGERSATITFTAGDAEPKSFVLTQAAYAAALSIDPVAGDKSVTNAEGEFDVTVSSNATWTAIPSSTGGWITIKSGDTETGNGTTVVKYEKNTTDVAREGTITFSADGVTPQVIILKQDPTAEISIVESANQVSSSQGSITVEVTSNMVWTVEQSSSYITSMTPMFGDAGETTVTITYAANYDVESPRDAVITFTAGSDDNTDEEKLTFTQAGAIAPFDVVYSSNDYESGGTSFNYTFTSEKTLKEIFGVAGDIYIDDLEIEETVSFTTTDYAGNTGTESVTLSYAVEGDMLEVTFPATLTTCAIYSGSTTVKYGDLSTTLNLDYAANGYPIEFNECLAKTTVSGQKVLLSSNSTRYNAYEWNEETFTMTIDASDANNETGVLAMGFVEPCEEAQAVLTLSTNSNGTATYCWTYDFTLVEVDTDIARGQIHSSYMYIHGNCWYIQAASHLDAALTTAGTSISSPSVLEFVTNRYWGVATGKTYELYMQVKFKDSSATTVWYNTGMTVVMNP